jgi:hypothetical protein
MSNGMGDGNGGGVGGFSGNIVAFNSGFSCFSDGSFTVCPTPSNHQCMEKPLIHWFAIKR